MRQIVVYCALSGCVGLLAGIFLMSLMMMAGSDSESSSSAPESTW